jgi:hypothetical protein
MAGVMGGRVRYRSDEKGGRLEGFLLAPDGHNLHGGDLEDGLRG